MVIICEKLYETKTFWSLGIKAAADAYVCNNSIFLRGDVKIPHSRMTKTCWETWSRVCEINATSHKRPFVLSVVQAEDPVSFVKRRQRSPTGQLIPLDGSVTFCEKFVVRGREF